MSCGNFKVQEDFKLMAWGMNGEEDFEYDDMIWEFNNFLEKEEKKRPLFFFELCLQSGYYEGMQVLVKEAKFPWDGCTKDNPHDMSNEDCKYWYDECRSKCVKKYDSEKNYINNKLLPKLKELGFIELVISAKFSNGETWYSKVG